jgi:uncharacterized protein YfaS (alpha-2-macroglobulin family)
MKRSAMQLAMAVVCLVGSIWAQTDSASLRVLVEDPSGSPIPGAKVVLLNAGNGQTLEQEGNEEGYALFSPIPRGLYEVNVAKSGFRGYKLNEVRLQVDERR